MQAKVLGVFVGEYGSQVSVAAEKIMVFFRGVSWDRHKTESTLAGVQESHIVEKYRPVANFRQLTIMAKEEMDIIAGNLRVPRLYAEDFSANILLSGVPDFTMISPVYYLVFSNERKETHAVIRLMGENRPCIVAGRNMQDRYPEVAGLQSRFPKAAMHLRGQVAICYAEGVIRKGDTVDFIPHQPEI